MAGWVSTLPIKPGPKNLLLRTLQFKRNDAKSFADHLQQVAGMRALIETELTLDDVTKWFADHPDAGLGHFLAGHEETLYVSEAFESTNGIAFMVNDVRMDDGSVVMENYSAWVDLPVCVVRALLRCDGDTPEGAPATRAAIKQICTTSQSIVEQAIQAEYGGVDLNWRRHADFSGASSIHLPEYLFDLIEKMPHFSDLDGFPMAATLALCDSPRAGDTLEKWHENADRVTKPRTERFLETWRTRNLLHKKRMEFFHDLAVGRLGPDDLLTKQPSWTWKDGRYVQNLTIDD